MRDALQSGDVRRPAAAATREALLAAGLETFAARGFDGARVGQIARAAGVNKALVSYHFGGKLGLFGAIVSGMLDEITGRLSALRDPQVPADARLQEFVRVWGELAQERPDFPPMMLRELLSGGAHLGEEQMRRVLGVFELVREIIAQGVAEGRFRAVDPLLTHLSLMGSLMFFFATAPARERLLAQRRLPVAAPDNARFVSFMQELIGVGLSTPSTWTRGGAS